MEAGVPIIPVSLDYPIKTMSIGEAFYPTGDIEKDKLRKFFEVVVGKVPEWN